MYDRIQVSIPFRYKIEFEITGLHEYGWKPGDPELAYEFYFVACFIKVLFVLEFGIKLIIGYSPGFEQMSIGFIVCKVTSFEV